MSSAQYQLVTEWDLRATVAAVWEELMHPELWPARWKGVRLVELLESGDASGVGGYRRMTWRSALPYELTFNMRTTVIEPQRRIEGVADGELSGRGIWTVAAQGAHTQVRYDWRVDATKAWMRMLAPVARPLFAWNHGVVMEWGRAGLARRLNAPAARPA
jgi:hypothetical protein